MSETQHAIMRGHEGHEGKTAQSGAQAQPSLLDEGITSIPQLQEHARTHGGRILEPSLIRDIMPEDLHSILEGVEYVLVDTTGRIGYQAVKKTTA